jgi:hypothetical protein
MTITGIVASNNKCPKDFILAGSIDFSNWVLLSSQSNITDYTNFPTKTFNIYNNTLYYYYRLIVTKTVADSNLSICELLLYGTQNTKFTNLDTYNNITYNTNEKQFPPFLFDSYTTEQSNISNEIFNCVPLNPFKQTITLNNHGTYTIYSSTTAGFGTLNKEHLFNYSLNPANWGTSQYTNGSYSANTNYIKDSSYKGDWVIIKLPFKLILTKFRFYQRTNTEKFPITWKCYASNDGINFIEIYEANDLTGATYANDYTQKTLPSLFDIPYLYIGWTFGSLIANSNSTQLEITEIQLFGKDDISNSYLNTWNKLGLNTYNITGKIGIGTTEPNNYKLNINGDFNASTISSNGYNLDLLYTKNITTSNLLYNISTTPEYKYPPKGSDSSSNYGTVSISSELPNISPSMASKDTITILQSPGIINGIGEYIIYSSSSAYSYKTALFDADVTNISYWAFNYNPTNNGYFYETINSYIINDYKGDWIIIKLPISIILTKIKFIINSYDSHRGPSLWRCYGSNDGITFTIIPEASNELIPLILTDYISNTYFIKQLNSSFNTSYKYIGITFKKIIGNAAASSILGIRELELYGKELLSITPIYTTSNQVMANPNIIKKFGFICSIINAVTINSTNYYKFDIDLTKYTSIQYLNGITEPHRIFKITIYKNSAYFSAINNDIPDILSYEIYMSYKASNGSLSNETSGINICAIGYPINYKLDKIMPTSIFLMNNTDFNYISIISTSNINVRCIITDLLN